MRIVSLLPSATEIVCALGLEDELVGVTHECDWPPDVIGKPVMTRSTHELANVPSDQIHRLVTDAMHGGSSLYESTKRRWRRLGRISSSRRDSARSVP